MRNWLLPEYVEDVLPAEALHIEILRRKIIDLLFLNGYQLVSPPLLEYMESLLSGSGSDMDLQMFKVVDQLSGRIMGLRADMTPQVARIDAHLLNCEGITRLCYANSVLHTVPTGLTRTREPLQIGAEIYGHTGFESDIEIQRLMLRCLSISGIDKIHLDLGHVGVFRGLIRSANISTELEAELRDSLQAKDTAKLKSLCTGLSRSIRQALLLLPELYGDRKVLSRIVTLVPGLDDIKKALNTLKIVENELTAEVDSIAFDLADLRGYHYHNGMVFTAYIKGCAGAIASGGRYDEIGKTFGRARPATGFSMDLRELSQFITPKNYPKGILAPYRRGDLILDRMVEQLRDSGEIVVINLPGSSDNKQTFTCDRQLIFKNENWIVETLKNG